MAFTFYQLVNFPQGYALMPHVTIYPDLIEILEFRESLKADARRVRKEH